MERGESEVGVNGLEEIEPACASVPLQRWRCTGVEKVENVARRAAVLEWNMSDEERQSDAKRVKRLR